MKKKYIIIIFISIILLIGIASFIIYKKIEKNRLDNELYNKLNVVVKDYYKDYFYYNVLGHSENERKTNASVFRHNGIKITLYDLSKYKEDNRTILEQFKNTQTKVDCDYDKTIITIYPLEPFGDEDIRIDSTIVCGL